MTIAPNPSKPSICFVALNAYGVLSGREDIQHIGGAEVQQSLIARELARRGYGVSFVTLDHGQPDAEVLDGIKVFKAYNRGAGLRVVRSLYPRLIGLWSAMRRADADVYYQRCAGTETGLVANWCRRHQRRFVFAVAGDPACPANLDGLHRVKERVLYPYGLRRAESVVAQTAAQRTLLRERFLRHSIVIPSCALDPGTPNYAQRSGNHSPRLLWIGRFDPVKGLSSLLTLAQLCSDYGFDVVGDDTCGRPVTKRDVIAENKPGFTRDAQNCANLVLHGWVPYAEIAECYRHASALVCTSVSEGFPNTFLEAWSHGLPVFSHLDPDNLISRYGLGVVAKDVFELARRIREFFRLPGEWERSCVRARRHFLKHHTVSAVVDMYERLLTRVPYEQRCDHQANAREDCAAW